MSNTEPPSQQEADSYYAGLRSCPRLIARTSTTPWAPPKHDRWPPGKNLHPVGPHALSSIWDSHDGTLKQEIIQCLSGVDWRALDVLRIGLAEDITMCEPAGPTEVTLFISVRPGSTPWAAGQSVVDRCKLCLERRGVHDVEVDMLETSVVRLAALADAPKLVPPSTPADVLDKVTTELPGSSMARANYQNRQGAKGVYLKSRSTPAVYALTCNHVVFPWGTRECRHDGQTPLNMIQPGRRSLDAAEIRTHCSFDGYLMYHPPEDRTDESSLSDNGRAAIQAKALLKAMEPPEARIIRHVAYSPRMEPRATQWGCPRLRDWALVELHQGKHTTPLPELQNALGLHEDDHFQIRMQLEAEVPGGFRGPAGFFLDRPVPGPAKHTTVPIRGVVPEVDTLCSPGAVVYMHGPMFGFRMGVVNDLSSVIRSVHSGREVVSHELCIVGGHCEQDTRDGFAMEGDSGPCIVDAEGRAVAMVTGGRGGQRWLDACLSIDVSYATPMSWILEDVRECGFDVDLL